MISGMLALEKELMVLLISGLLVSLVKLRLMYFGVMVIRVQTIRIAVEPYSVFEQQIKLFLCGP